MNKINSIVAVAVLITAFAACVWADCYTEYGCKDAGRGKQYSIGQRWKPKSNLCYSCKCISVKKYVLECMKEVKPLSVKKSARSKKVFSAQLEETQMDDDEQETEIMITKKEAATKKCDPVRAPTFNWQTMTFEDVTYRPVLYYYKQKQSRCCSRFSTYINVHPDCKVRKIGKCRSIVVEKANPKKLCRKPMAMVG